MLSSSGISELDRNPIAIPSPDGKMILLPADVLLKESQE
jgi:hypothetical protein